MTPPVVYGRVPYFSVERAHTLNFGWAIPVSIYSNIQNLTFYPVRQSGKVGKQVKQVQKTGQAKFSFSLCFPHTSHHSSLTLTPLTTPPSLLHLSALLPHSHTSQHSFLSLTPLTTPPSLSHLSPLLPHSYTFPTHSMRIGKKYWLSLPSHTPPTNSWYSSMTILEKFFSRFLIYRVSRNKNFINKKTQDASGVVNASKLWKYIGHTIVPYYTTIQDQHTFNAYHPIFSLTHRLSVYCMVLLYDSIVQCFVWQYFMVQLH